MSEFVCIYCNKICVNLNSLLNHERLCHNNPNFNTKKYQCKWCGKFSPTKDGNSRHEKACKLNPDRKIYKSPWNKGLTQQTSTIVKQITDKNKNREGTFKNKHHSELSKLKISTKLQNNHNNNPNKTGRGKKGWYKSFYCSSTYELAFVIYCLDHNYPIRRYTGFYEYQYNGKNHRYYPDFIVNDTIYEIKGYWTEVVDIKTAAVTDRPIKVLYREDMKQIFDYISEVYHKQVDKNISDLYESSR